MQTVINIGLLEDNVKFKNFLWSFPKWSKVSLFQLLNPFKWPSPVNHHRTKSELEKSILSVLLGNVTSAEEWQSGDYIMASHWSWGSGAWQKHSLVSDHHISSTSPDNPNFRNDQYCYPMLPQRKFHVLFDLCEEILSPKNPPRKFFWIVKHGFIKWEIQAYLESLIQFFCRQRYTINTYCF